MKQQSYRLLALDMDGTLLNSQHLILESSLKALQKAKENGIKIVLATGRHHLAARPYHVQLQLDTPMICCNGTYSFDMAEQKVFNANPLSLEQATAMLDIGDELGISMALYVPDAMTMGEMIPYIGKMKSWADSLPEHLRPVVRINNLREEAENANQIFKIIYTHSDPDTLREGVRRVNDVVAVSSEYSWIDRVDICNSGNTKGNSLQKIADLCGIDMSEVVAVGDNENDISMLRAAGLGVAMKGLSYVESEADLVIGTNDENSIERIVEEFLL
ncbi:pyridoxal phosphatase [Sansalvadorimonas sp. 2012CJ34-2]|uniref:Pyridoxal phosphatase n=1 Tax=Parendozoicomonas callyspongiae TaxID=2942213 RepID=A0ABT0PJZ4_9GAMM|nr:pyridoxal phosphatase [Sansalvadorimonas sp. 2012CJ34-2]MCL6271714.1 pyridoxal phosphatase [Sansalvadorimonas sp. 2012CJ34-2]